VIKDDNNPLVFVVENASTQQKQNTKIDDNARILLSATCELFCEPSVQKPHPKLDLSGVGTPIPSRPPLVVPSLEGSSAPPVYMAQLIKQLDKSTLNRICGGQVVIDLSGAVKELIENAIDAGATSVELRLREFGAEAIELSDNGKGIPPSEYAAVTKKSCTSKISCFEDVYRVASFGFRGEALSALCELSSGFELVTRTATDATATHIVYERDGSIRSQRPAARPVGTTVTVSGLFSPLPVRHREFMRALKKQYASMMGLLQAFALVSKGVRFSATNLPTGSSKDAPTASDKPHAGFSAPAKAAAWQRASSEVSTPPTKSSAAQRVMSTSGSGSLRDVVGELFGSDFLSSLTDFAVDLPDATKSRRRRGGGGVATRTVPAEGASEAISDADDGAPAEAGAEEEQPQLPAEAGPAERVRAPLPRVVGLVSRAGTGIGRSNNEKQFMFLNGRPVDLPRVTKALNETWRQYEMAHKPAAILDFQVRPTYDCRSVICRASTELLAAACV
jgi:DNA mismatch repair protein MutL